jgi:hypothetical protein
MAVELKSIAQIFTIGITNQTDDQLLSALSSGGVKGVDWFSSPTFEGLEEIRDAVVQETCIAVTQAPTTIPTTTSTFFSHIAWLILLCCLRMH